VKEGAKSSCCKTFVPDKEFVAAVVRLEKVVEME
jgi:hypothetical protein